MGFRAGLWLDHSSYYLMDLQVCYCCVEISVFILGYVVFLESVVSLGSVINSASYKAFFSCACENNLCKSFLCVWNQYLMKELDFTLRQQKPRCGPGICLNWISISTSPFFLQFWLCHLFPMCLFRWSCPASLMCLT